MTIETWVIVLGTNAIVSGIFGFCWRMEWLDKERCRKGWDEAILERDTAHSLNRSLGVQKEWVEQELSKARATIADINEALRKALGDDIEGMERERIENLSARTEVNPSLAHDYALLVRALGAPPNGAIEFACALKADYLRLFENERRRAKKGKQS
jgi:hypothetical protein